ncbi:hypothetical protein SEVIR_5G389900v4 [Setaria viridis]
METVAAASYAGRATSATRSPTCCAAMSFSQSYRPKASRPPTTFYGESVRVSTARPLSARQSKAASRAALNTRCEIGDSLVRVPDQGDAGQEPHQAAHLHGGSHEDDRLQGPDGVLRRHGLRQLLRRRAARRRHARQQAPLRCVKRVISRCICLSRTEKFAHARSLCLQALEYSHVCKYACSEEVPELQDMGGPVEGGFSVAFDPLDGSSIVDTNFTVGTIFGVWPGDKLTGVTGGDQVAAAMGIYGPRTTYVIALKDCPGTHEFLLLDEGKWQHVKDTTSIGEGKMFSPGNLRATFDNPDYDKLINYYVKEKYTLRYTGGMVPDVNQIIVKEKGIFTNVTSPSAKAKLRLLFEVAPLGFLMEKAGGHSSDGKQSVLDKVINELDERTQVAYGSKNEIIRFEETLYGSSRLTAGATVGAAA